MPVLDNIHTQVLTAIEQYSLDMFSWHKCRAGRVITLAGKEGRRLKEQTSSLFAAMQIYHKSSQIKVPPQRFFDSNEKSKKDITRCAALEIGDNQESKHNEERTT